MKRNFTFIVLLILLIGIVGAIGINNPSIPLVKSGVSLDKELLTHIVTADDSAFGFSMSWSKVPYERVANIGGTWINNEVNRSYAFSNPSVTIYYNGTDVVVTSVNFNEGDVVKILIEYEK